ncbi:MAG: hypothetical protein QGG53_01965, partial [Planctomycetota bacterium]|nr:hypothetical protein [Planctomycetota bacterium]
FHFTPFIMPRHIHILSAVIAICIVIAAIFGLNRGEKKQPSPDERDTGVRLLEGTIHVEGKEVTLAAIEAAVKDHEVFRFDEKKDAYYCNANIEVTGSLLMGDPENAAKKETLEIRTYACGDRSIRIRPGGALKVFHSEIATVLRSFDEKMCARGYTIFNDGRFELEGATMSFLSGNFGRTVRGDASARISKSRFVDTDDNSFFADNVHGSKVKIVDSEFVSRGNHGFVVIGPGTDPLRLIRCKLRGVASDIHHGGKDADVVLQDCDFRKDKISFNQLNGEIVIKWSVEFSVKDKKGAPQSNALVTAASHEDCGKPETVSGRTGSDGKVTLILTEFVASPFNPSRLDVVNNSTPHELQVSIDKQSWKAGTVEAAKTFSKQLVVERKGRR